MSNFLTFRKYSTQEQATQISELLESNGLETILANNSATVDLTFSGNNLQNDYEVKVKPEDFRKANELLDESVIKSLNEVNSDHYLFEFSNEELYDLLLKSDEWNEFDVKLARKILCDRGKEIDDELISTLKNQRIETLSKPEENQKVWIICGYLLSILGGFLGIIIGYFLWTSKKTLPNGEQVYSYRNSDRAHGRIIFTIGIIIFPIVLAYRIFSKS